MNNIFLSSCHVGLMLIDYALMATNILNQIYHTTIMYVPKGTIYTASVPIKACPSGTCTISFIIPKMGISMLMVAKKVVIIGKLTNVMEKKGTI